MGGSQREASLDGLRLAREIAQVDLRLGEKILSTRSGYVFHTFADACAKKPHKCYITHAATVLMKRKRKEEKRTSPSKAADAVDFDADQDGLGSFHSAIVSDNLQDVIVILFVIQGLGAANDTYLHTKGHSQLDHVKVDGGARRDIGNKSIEEGGGIYIKRAG